MAILRTECGIGPNAAIAAAKFHHREIGVCRSRCDEADRQKAKKQKAIFSISAPCTDLSVRNVVFLCDVDGFLASSV